MSSRTRNVWILTAAVLFAAAALFVPAVQAAGKGNKWIALRYRFKSEQKLEYKINMTISAQNPDGASMNVDMDTNLRMNVSDVDSDGAATVTMALDEMNMDMQTMGQSVNMRMGASGMKLYSGGQILYDSSTTGGAAQSPMGDIPGFGGMMDQKLFRQGITATITKLGETTIAETVSTPGRDAMDYEMFEQALLPEKLVRPGDTWATDIPIPGLAGPGSKSAELTGQTVLESIETFNGRLCARNVMQIDADVSQLALGQQGFPGMNLPKMRLTGQITTYFDIEGGYVRRERGEFSMNMVGDGSAGGQSLGAGAAMRITTSMELRE